MNHMIVFNSDSRHILLDFNRLAVSFLEQGQSKKAMDQFLMGLRKAGSREDDAQASDPFMVPPGKDDAGELQTDDALHATALPPVECDDSHSNFFPLFEQALSYDDSLLSSEKEQSVDLSLITSVYLFNIGLALHRQGIAKGISSLLQDALRFYQLARESSLDQNPLRESLDYQLVMFSIHNNMGNIFARFFDRENANTCYKLIMDLAPSVSRALAEHEAFIATLYNLISDQEMFQFAPAA